MVNPRRFRKPARRTAGTERSRSNNSGLEGEHRRASGWCGTKSLDLAFGTASCKTLSRLIRAVVGVGSLPNERESPAMANVNTTEVDITAKWRCLCRLLTSVPVVSGVGMPLSLLFTNSWVGLLGSLSRHNQALSLKPPSLVIVVSDSTIIGRGKGRPGRQLGYRSSLGVRFYY